MPQDTHINVTIDYTSKGTGGTYDLRIPVFLPIKQLLSDIQEALKRNHADETGCAVKIKTKNLVLADDDILNDYPVANGDILTVL